MILRRVTEHLKHQHWTAIWIDLVIVILGVFIGTQVSNWNASRHENAEAREYAQRIRDDLDDDLRSIEGRQAFWKQVNGYGSAAIHYAETGELVQGSAWKTVLAFYQASQVWPWVGRDQTYQELRSAGQLGLIRSPRQRTDLALYYSTASGANVSYLLAFLPEYRKIVRGLTPSVVSNQIWTKCWTQPNEMEQRLLDCDSPMSERDAQAVLDMYMKDPSLLPELRYWVVNQGVALNLIDNTHALASKVRASMEAPDGSAP